MRTIYLALAFFFGISLATSHGQSPLSVVDVVPYIQIDTTVGLMQPPAPNMATQPFWVNACVKLSDTVNVQNVHFKIGRQVDSSDVVNMSIPYNYSNLPIGVTAINKEENRFTVNFGVHTNAYTLHFEIWAEDANGTLSQVYQKRLN